MFLQGHIRCRSDGLAQPEVHRKRSPIPEFRFAARALTLLCHYKFDKLFWFNQVKSDKGGDTTTHAKGRVPKIKARNGL